MGLKMEIDLLALNPGQLVRAAKFMLEFAGYQAPAVGQQNEQMAQEQQMQSPLAAGVGGDVVVSRHLPLHPSIAQGLVTGAGAMVPPPPVPDVTVAAPAAPPPPLATAAPVPPAALPPPPPGIEVDANGVPWDQRIHAGSRAKVADGTWRQRRNLDPDVLTQVMAELRQTMGIDRRVAPEAAAPAPQLAFAPVPPVPTANNEDPHVMSALNAVPPVPVVPPAPFATAAVPPVPPISTGAPIPPSAGAAASASPSSAPTFPALMGKITALFTAKQLTQADVQAAVAGAGLASLPMLASRPDLVGDVATRLGIAL